MKTLLIYLLLSSICTGAFYIAYKTFIAKESFIALNRCVIIGSIITSFILPLVSFNIDTASGGSQIADVIYAINLNEVVVNTTQEEIATATSIESNKLWSVLYLIGVMVTFALTTYSISKINGLTRKANQKLRFKESDLFIHNISNQGPVSWNNSIILSEEDYDKNKDEILTHEYAHIKLKHSLDISFLQFIGIIQWFNPFIWLFKNELQRVHEFQADEYVLKSGIDAQKYQLLLIKKSVGELRFNLANNFSRRDLSKRIKMMVNEKSKSGMKWKYAYIIPLAVAMIFVVGNSNKVNAKDLSQANNVENTKDVSIHQQDTTVYYVVDEIPTFPGGPKGMMTFLGNNVSYPKSASDAGIEGRVIVSFIVETDGSVSNIAVVRSVDPALDVEAIEAVKKMPKWIPGKTEGETVRVSYTLPILFRLPEAKQEASK